MAQIYQLNYQPNITSVTHSAFLTLDFTLDNVYDIELRGSYNMVDVTARSLYIDNSLNADEVNVISLNGELNKIVPPRGQMWVTVAGFPRVRLLAGAGVANIEITDKSVPDFIFQRTDGFTNYLPTSNASFASANDLVTVDILGRVQGTYAPVFANNNITGPTLAIPLATTPTYPSAPFGGNNFTAPEIRTIETQDGSYLSVSANGANTIVWEHSTAVDRTVSTALGGPTIRNYAVCETPNSYLIKVNTAAVLYSIDKNTFTASLLVSGAGFTFGGTNISQSGVLIADSESDDSFVYIGGNNALSTEIRGARFNSAGVIQSMGAGIVIPAGNYFTGATALVKLVNTGKKWNNGNYIVSRTISNGGGAFPPARAIVAMLDASFNSIDVFTTNILSIQTDRPGAESNTLLDVGNKKAFCFATAAGAVTVRWYDENGFVSTTTLGTCLASTPPVFAVLGGELFAFYINNASNIRVDKITEALAVTSYIHTLPSTASYPVAIFKDAKFLYLAFYNIPAGQARMTVYDFIDSVWYNDIAQTTRLPSVSQFVINLGNKIVKFEGTNAVPVVTDLFFQKTVFGVLKDMQNVAITGQHQINTNYPGSLAFNYNASTPIGNRGIVFGNTVVLNGLTP